MTNESMYEVMVWKDYSITETYTVKVSAKTEVEALALATIEVSEGRGELLHPSDPGNDIHSVSYEANEDVKLIGEL
jgi:hypothetical protein